MEEEVVRRRKAQLFWTGQSVSLSRISFNRNESVFHVISPALSLPAGTRIYVA